MSRAFDAIGAQYSQVFADKPGQVAAGQWLIAQLPPDAVVLDVGCGSGVPTARQLVDAGLTVVGVDASPVMLDLARHSVPTAIFVEREMHDLSGLHPHQERFDAVVAFFSLLMLTREDLGKTLDSVRGVLKPEGYFVMGMVEGDSDFLMREFLGVPVPLTAYPRADLGDLLQHHGFTVLDMRVDEWHPSTSDSSGQTHLYSYCRVIPSM